MENALSSGLFEDEGMVLIAGTGMVAYGKNRFGETHKAGGLGYKEGDLGSAYDLGLKTIQAAAKALDHRYEMTAFTHEIIESLNFKEPNDVIQFMEANRENRTLIASLDPIVTIHADLGDEYARLICDGAINELVLSGKAIKRRLKIENPKLVIVSSLGNNTTYIKKTLHSKLVSNIQMIAITEPKVDPVLASSMLAIKTTLS